MKMKAFFAAVLFLPMTILAQDKDIQEAVEHPEKENFLKINLTSLPLKNYQLQFEHVLSRKVSVALGARSMPNSGIPFKSVVTTRTQETLLKNPKLETLLLLPRCDSISAKAMAKVFTSLLFIATPIFLPVLLH